MTKNKARYIVKKNPNTSWEPWEVIDTLTGICHEGSSLKAHSQRIADRMNLEAKPVQKHTLKTREDMLKLSYYTLCKLSDATMCGAIDGVPHLVARGEYKGILTTDDLGNFISFK